MAGIALNRHTVLTALQDTLTRLADLVDGIDDLDQSMQGFEWTVGQTVRHVVAVLTGFNATVRGHGDALGQFVPDAVDFSSRLAGTNNITLGLFQTSDIAGLATQLKGNGV